MEHSILAASAAPIWGNSNGCSAYPLMVQRYPEKEQTQDQKEGEAAHQIGAELVEAFSRGARIDFDNYRNKFHSNGIMYDVDMYCAAMIYAQDCKKVMQHVGVFGGNLLGVESQVYMPQIHEINFGTTDCYLYSPKHNTLWIWDFKYGIKFVDVYGNLQLIDYYAGIFNKLGLIDDVNLNVVFRIIQPRCYSHAGIIREWKTKGSTLRPYVNQLHMKAHEAMQGGTCKSGWWCCNCPALLNCEIALHSGLALFELASKPIEVDLSNLALGVQYSIVKRAKDQIEAIETALKEIIHNKADKGEIVPYWQSSNKNVKVWKENFTTDDIINIGKFFNKDLKKKVSVLTPTQALSIGVPDAALFDYYDTKPTGKRLTPVQDKSEVFSNE